MDNHAIAARLRQHAAELEKERGNLLRVRAYRRAAETIVECEEPVAALLSRGGRRALLRLATIGPHIATAIECLLLTGGFPPRATPAA